MVVVKHRNSRDVILLRVDRPTLEDADLTEAYLSCAEMAGLRCRRAVLRDANLREADLRGADLGATDLTGASLKRADLRGASLVGACLNGADLCGATLVGADLCGADLSHAVLFDADLTDVHYDDDTRWPEGGGYTVGAPVEAPAPRPAIVSWFRGIRGRIPTPRWTSQLSAAEYRFSLATLTAACGVAALLGVVVGNRLAPASPNVRIVHVPVPTPERTDPLDPTYRQRVTRRAPRMAVRLSQAQGRPRRRSLRPRGERRPLATAASRARSVRRNRRRPPRWVLARYRPRRGEVRPARAAYRRRVAASRPSSENGLTRSRDQHPGAGRAAVASRPSSENGLTLVAYRAPISSPRSGPTPGAEAWRDRPVHNGLRFAWGNPGFHYGSGYDTYHLPGLR